MLTTQTLLKSSHKSPRELYTNHEGFVPLLTDEALGMTDYEGFVPLLTDEVLGMTDHKGFLLAEEYLPLLAEQDLSISF